MLYDSKRWDAKLPVNTDGFKTARQLGLMEEQYRALIRTLERFERGEIPPLLFTMMDIGQPECGTAGCICGWASEGNASLFMGWSNNPKLKKLFAPDGNDASPAWGATVQQAAVAIRNYLMTADPKWDEVMGLRKPA